MNCDYSHPHQSTISNPEAGGGDGVVATSQAAL